MTSIPAIRCRLHPSTGRLSCSYVTSARSRPSWPTAPTDESTERSRREAVRRARQRVRELVFDYDLRLLWTLTYADQQVDHRAVVHSTSAFSRRLRVKGARAPRLIVPEQSFTGRWHLHMAVPMAFEEEVLHSSWRQGAVHGPDMHQAHSDGALEKLTSYLTKAFDNHPKGARRYVTSAGLRPIEQRFTATNAAAALAMASERLGAAPQHWDWYAGTFMAFFDPTDSTGRAR